MIDGLKFILYYNLDFYRNHPLLDFQTATSVTTGEVIKQKNPFAKYRGFIFEDRIKNIEVRGSIHKYFNEGKHNWNDFGINELIVSINEFCSVFNIDASNIKLDNLEVGVNIQLPFEISTFLDSLIMSRGKGFDRQTSHNMNLRECQHSQFYIKVYDKGLQYQLKSGLMRFEIKFRKMERPNLLGVKLLSDLLVEKKLVDLSIELLRVYDELYIGDLTFRPDNLTEIESELFFRGHQYSYWRNEKQKVKELKVIGKDYERKLEHFKMLLLSTGANQKKLVVYKLIQSKIEQLLDSSYSQDSYISSSFDKTEQLRAESLGKLTDVDTISFGESDQDVLGKLTGDGNIQKGETDTLLYSVSYPPNKRQCLVTGLDISMQKESSSFLCTTGIKFYQKNHPDIWRELKYRLSVKWLTQKEYDQIREVAHSIRNEFNNSKRDVGKCYHYPSLFDQREFIREDKLRLFLLKSQPIANNNKIQCHAI